jgi:DNA repair exonuclease SbcCD ATPase subunit
LSATDSERGIMGYQEDLKSYGERLGYCSGKLDSNNRLIEKLKEDLVSFNQKVLDYDKTPWFSRFFFSKLWLFLFGNIEKQRELVCYEVMVRTADSLELDSNLINHLTHHLEHLSFFSGLKAALSDFLKGWTASPSSLSTTETSPYSNSTLAPVPTLEYDDFLVIENVENFSPTQILDRAIEVLEFNIGHLWTDQQALTEKVNQIAETQEQLEQDTRAVLEDANRLEGKLNEQRQETKTLEEKYKTLEEETKTLEEETKILKEEARTKKEKSNILMKKLMDCEDKLSKQQQETRNLEDKFNQVLDILQNQGMNPPSANSENGPISSQTFFK